MISHSQIIEKINDVTMRILVSALVISHSQIIRKTNDVTTRVLASTLVISHFQIIGRLMMSIHGY
jgi:hypothetical protein